ncbi:unnamed protein product [Ilex paraguariensis]|uniref:Uncharacterized protein n=1 Tax=Ilex paraguariensis TaxID=185542 RepID=A0ABC8UN98_9AQUA
MPKAKNQSEIAEVSVKIDEVSMEVKDKMNIEEGMEENVVVMPFLEPEVENSLSFMSVKMVTDGVCAQWCQCSGGGMRCSGWRRLAFQWVHYNGCSGLVAV